MSNISEIALEVGTKRLRVLVNELKVELDKLDINLRYNAVLKVASIEGVLAAMESEVSDEN